MKQFKIGLAIVALAVAISGAGVITAGPQAVAGSKKSTVKTSETKKDKKVIKAAAAPKKSTVKPPPPKKGPKDVSSMDLGSGR